MENIRKFYQDLKNDLENQVKSEIPFIDEWGYPIIYPFNNNEDRLFEFQECITNKLLSLPQTSWNTYAKSVARTLNTIVPFCRVVDKLIPVQNEDGSRCELEIITRNEKIFNTASVEYAKKIGVALIYESFLDSKINLKQIALDMNLTLIDYDYIANYIDMNAVQNRYSLKVEGKKFCSIMTQAQLTTMFRLFRGTGIIDENMNDSELARVITHIAGGSLQPTRRNLGGQQASHINMTLTNITQAKEIQDVLVNIISKIEEEKKGIIE